MLAVLAFLVMAREICMLPSIARVEAPLAENQTTASSDHGVRATCSCGLTCVVHRSHGCANRVRALMRFAMGQGLPPSTLARGRRAVCAQ